MSNNVVTKLVKKIKSKISNKEESLIEEYKFSNEEIEDLSVQNKQKLETLKTETNKKKNISFTSVSKKLNGLLDENIKQEESKEHINAIIKTKAEEDFEEESIPIKENKEKDNNTVIEEETIKEEQKTKNEDNVENSYINLSEKNQGIIMKSWNNIDLQQIDKDIIEGKDLINHNYNITYGDKAAKFVHDIRKRYEVVICYLIGFNNEKKGIMNKTIFADKVDDEWKYLNKYIKLLEKIRSFRK